MSFLWNTAIYRPNSATTRLGAHRSCGIQRLCPERSLHVWVTVGVGVFHEWWMSLKENYTQSNYILEKLSRHFWQFSWCRGGPHRAHRPAVCPSLSAVWRIDDELELSDGRTCWGRAALGGPADSLRAEQMAATLHWCPHVRYRAHEILLHTHTNTYHEAEREKDKRLQTCKQTQICKKKKKYTWGLQGKCSFRWLLSAYSNHTLRVEEAFRQRRGCDVDSNESFIFLLSFYVWMAILQIEVCFISSISGGAVHCARKEHDVCSFRACVMLLQAERGDSRHTAAVPSVSVRGCGDEF